MTLVTLLGLIVAPSLAFVEANFDIIWNVPTFLCSHRFGLNMTKDVLKYKILVNDKESFIGDKIALIYEEAMGRYPKIDPKKGDVNGGVPTLDALDEHLKIAEMNISAMIPNPNFNGLGIIDWEAWRPSWEFLWGSLSIYRKRTIELLKNREGNSDVDAAKRVWENTAKQWMLQTLQLVKKLRPEGRWCYYLFPDCYNYFGKDKPSQFFCSAATSSVNDRLSWMWDESTALCPSIYVHEKELGYNATQRIWYIYGKLAEAVRVSRPKTKIYPYVNYMLHESRVFVPKDIFWKVLALVASMGLDGSVIWGSSSYFPKKSNCEDLKAYIHDVIGPAAVTISRNVNCCSETICNGRGKCTWPDEPYTSWRYLVNKGTQNFDSKKIVCRCRVGKGRYCHRKSG